ncbi:MAG: Uncharacterized protein G01um101493_419 [Microgenomates group bacterium Gr01-1014_93]|nr:MAG: Uncharacterized protein G01um101493_419 [Microgenomates group bacterium Gr01-1014_93]
MKIFYSELINIEVLVEELHGMDLNEAERRHLATLLDSSLHHAILDEILSNLNSTDKKIFLNKLQENPEDKKLLEFLNGKIEGIEGRIKKVSEDLIKEMHEDVKEAKKL